jgi:microcystin-dependent protein
MGSPYVGEIRMFAGNFAPAGWAFCDGSQLAIADNDVLFQLIGTTYGGDGQTTFNLPDLRSRVPIHMGSSAGQTYTLGQSGGEEQVTLTSAQIPAHSHVPLCNSGAGNQGDPSSGIWAQQTSNSPYINTAPSLNMSPNAVGQSGGSQPHDNMVPFLVINFIISLFGVFPSPT